MEILGIGMPELLFIVVIALIILGPKDMQKAGKTIGAFLRKVVTSEGWKTFQDTSREIRQLPTRLMREANEDLKQLDGEIRHSIKPENQFGNWAKPPSGEKDATIQTPETLPGAEEQHEIAPPAVKTPQPKQEENA
jgi:Sec-independent protein translocase protein TatA